MAISNISSISIEDIPDEIADMVWPDLDKNGGNVISVKKDSEFGKFLLEQGYEFTHPRTAEVKTWGWVVVFR